MTRVAWIALLAALAGWASPVRVAGAEDRVVTDCGDSGGANQLRAGIAAVQSSGGTITFTCGPAIIVLDSQLPTVTGTITIDGGGQITLSGGNATRPFFVSSGVLTLRGITVSNGAAGNRGGAITVTNGELNAVDTIIQNSFSTDQGGGVSVDGSSVTFDTVTLRNNNGTLSGGGLYASSSSLDLTNVTFSKNTSGDAGGGLGMEASTMTWVGGVVSENTATNGGGVSIANTLLPAAPEASLSGVVVSANFATTGSGGGLRLTADTQTTIDGGAIELNYASQYGGGISTAGELTMSNTRVFGNSAGSGGGVHVAGSLQATGSLLEANAAYYSGGGVYAEKGTTTIVSSTFADNSTEEKFSSFGGGVYHYSGSTELRNVTMHGNYAARALAIFASSNALTVYNTLISKGFVYDEGNCNKALSGGFNLSSDASCGFGPGRDNVAAMKLGPLSDNGGATSSFLPAPDSPAVDAGTTAGCPATDQRGVARPQGLSCEVGAVEVCPNPTPVAVKPLDGRKAAGPGVTLDWSDASCATRYDVLVRAGSPSGPNAFRKKKLRTSTVQTGPLVVGQTYFWRVTARGPAGRAKSAWYGFTVK